MVGVFQDEDAPRKDRMEAASWLADRGFGKPQQTTLVGNIDSDESKPQLSEEEAKKKLKEGYGRLARVMGPEWLSEITGFEVSLRERNG